jgi:hypothetical protein
MKIRHIFSSAYGADENMSLIFVGPLSRRKYGIIFVGLFSSSLFRRPIFVGEPTKTTIFVGIRPIFVGFWPTKMSCFPVVYVQYSR